MLSWCLASIWPALGSLVVSAGDTCIYNVSIHTSTTWHVFISVLLVFILKVSPLSRVSLLLLFILICSYFISVLARETYILYNMYNIKIIFYILT